MSILVTGGAGFIGSNLIKKLIKSGKNVICLDNFSDFYSPEKKRENIKEYLKCNNFYLFEADIRDKDRLKTLFEKKKISKIIHLAAMAGVRPSLENPALYFEVNVLGTINLLELARDFNIKKIVFASSSSVYGNDCSPPFKETMLNLNPISPYAASKLTGENLCFIFNKLYGLNITVLRFFTVYGPMQRPDLAISKFTKLIDEGLEIPVFGKGILKRDFTFVDDAVEGILKALDLKTKKYEIFNIGENETHDVLTLIKLIENNLKKKAKIKWLPKQLGDVEITYADINKAQKFLHYNPKTKLKKGIKKYVEWYKQLM